MVSALACANCERRFANEVSFDYHLKRRGRGKCASAEKLGYDSVEFYGLAVWWKPGSFANTTDPELLARPWATQLPATTGGR